MFFNEKHGTSGQVSVNIFAQYFASVYCNNHIAIPVYYSKLNDIINIDQINIISWRGI